MNSSVRQREKTHAVSVTDIFLYCGVHRRVRTERFVEILKLTASGRYKSSSGPLMCVNTHPWCDWFVDARYSKKMLNEELALDFYVVSHPFLFI